MQIAIGLDVSFRHGTSNTKLLSTRLTRMSACNAEYPVTAFSLYIFAEALLRL